MLRKFFQFVEIKTKITSVFPFFLTLAYLFYQKQSPDPKLTTIFFLSMLLIDLATTAINNYIDSREYQGRWFTSINAWKVDRPMAAASQAAPMGVTPDNFAPASAPTAPASSAPDFGPANPIDDLPF